MALTLVKETGAGLANANSYADLNDAVSYHESHVSGSVWTAATNKELLLVQATRLIEAACRFKGERSTTTQVLAWPRSGAVSDGVALASDAVPPAVINATCELARMLIAGDVAAESGNQGVDSVKVGPIEVNLSGASKNALARTEDILPRNVLLLIRSLLRSGGMTANLVRA